MVRSIAALLCVRSRVFVCVRESPSSLATVMPACPCMHDAKNASASSDTTASPGASICSDACPRSCIEAGWPVDTITPVGARSEGAMKQDQPARPSPYLFPLETSQHHPRHTREQAAARRSAGGLGRRSRVCSRLHGEAAVPVLKGGQLSHLACAPLARWRACTTCALTGIALAACLHHTNWRLRAERRSGCGLDGRAAWQDKGMRFAGRCAVPTRLLILGVPGMNAQRGARLAASRISRARCRARCPVSTES
jgi:hypothetical protein